MSQVDLLNHRIAPADSEFTVRTYLCTFYRSLLLDIDAEGFLSVTKRIIFQTLSETSAGSCSIQSDMPIQDVSEVSGYKGTVFSFGRLLIGLAASWQLAVTASLLIAVVGARTHVPKLDPGPLGDGGRPIGADVVGWLVAIAAFMGSITAGRASIWHTVLAFIATSAMAVLGDVTLFEDLGPSFVCPYNPNGVGIQLLLACLLAIYGLGCAFVYARRPTFTLTIHSKGGSGTPIAIAGGHGIGIPTLGLERALQVEPGNDAEVILKELGALVFDVQMLHRPHPS